MSAIGIISPTLPRAIAVVLLCLSACAPAEQWRGTVEKIDGVVHVSNPAEPLWGTSEQGEPRLSLELEQVFGVDREPAEAILGDQYQLFADVDADGNVYVLDGQANQLVSFAADGAMRWRVSRQGEGPGELDEPREIAVGPDGTVAVGNDSGRQLSLWSSEGNHLSSVRLTDPPLALTNLRAPQFAGFMAHDRLVLSSGMPGKIGKRIVVIDPFAPATIQEFWLPCRSTPTTCCRRVRLVGSPSGIEPMMVVLLCLHNLSEHHEANHRHAPGRPQDPRDAGGARAGDLVR